MKIDKQKELVKTINKESKFIKSNVKKKDLKILKTLKEKVPKKLEKTLQKAFLKAFDIVFLKGTNIIEKSFSKEKILEEYYKDEEAVNLNAQKKELKELSLKSSKKSNINILASSLKGAGFGVLGIGPLDIPLFLAQILKAIYEISLSFGYDYKSDKEKLFILFLIKTALLEDDTAILNNMTIDKLIRSDLEYEKYTIDKEVLNVSNILCEKLLVSKFIQGMPLVGIIGGSYDGIFLEKILKFAKLKYYHRFLYESIKNENPLEN